MSETDGLYLRSDVLIVIRSAGERTTQLCESLLSRQVVPEHIRTIREVPFSQAVIRTFELGLKFGLPWTVAVDADVLVHPRAVHSLVALAEAGCASDFRLDVRLIDKLFGVPRCVGMHLYRTSHLDQALCFARACERVHRPEYHVVEQMRTVGYTDSEVEAVLGLHDFEQFYGDLYRKGFVHAQKHAELQEPLTRMWKRWSVVDPDFQAVLAGSKSGRDTGGTAVTDARQFTRSLADLGLKNLSEKPPLEIDDPVAQDLDVFIGDFDSSPDIEEFLQIQAMQHETSTQKPSVLSGLLLRARAILRIRSRARRLAGWIWDRNSVSGPQRPISSEPSESVSRPLEWHERDRLTPEFEQAVQASSPLACCPNSPSELHTLVDHQHLWTFALGAKSLLRFVDNLAIVLHDDGSLTEEDQVLIREHIPGLRIITRQEADERMDRVLDPYPFCRQFREKNRVMAQVFDFPQFTAGKRLITFDSDILFHSRPDEVLDWLTDDTAQVLFDEEVSPVCPQIHGVDITIRQDIPFGFVETLSGGFVCGFPAMYELSQIEEYCRFVLKNCHQQLYRSQTITAMSAAHSVFTPRSLPQTYQNPHSFAAGPVMRHYRFSRLPPAEFLRDAFGILKCLEQTAD
ncbi:MAG: hypothetical protein MK110_19605 [Fuerstiella sp.]|nr:hypothetical protein [Fuerstiella sp.]